MFIGDFPKSTIHSVIGLSATKKVLCNLNSNLITDGINQEPFPVLDNLTHPRTYQNANLKGFSSLKAPATIKQLLPGIIFDQAPLHCQPINNLLQNLSMPEGSANLAVINLNGAEREYLVESEILLNTFSSVLISCSNSNIFEGAAESYSNLLAHLETQNIAYSVFPAEVHPFSFILIHRMPNWKENEESQKAFMEVKQSANVLSQKLSEAESLLANKENELQAIVVEFAESEASHVDRLKQEQKRYELLEVQYNEKLAEIETLTVNAQSNAASYEDITAQCDKLEQGKELVEEELHKAKTQVDEQNQSVKIANKLNLKLQVDLDDLRQKYAEKEQNERELSQLIDELYVKLKQASEFYYELEKKYPELTDEQRD